ncbi:MAG: SMC-Scp complex subunit ScpB [Thiotrichales bacterium]
MDPSNLKPIVEALLMASDQPLRLDRLVEILGDADSTQSRNEIAAAVAALQADYAGRGVELAEVASGFRFQVRAEFAPWLSRLHEEKPPRYSRAVLETLALVAYKQPITRAEIEAVRGVTVSTQIVKTLLDRQWVKVIGHKDVPGRPALYATTRQFLDYFNLKTLDALPSLHVIKGDEVANRELEFREFD